MGFVILVTYGLILGTLFAYGINSYALLFQRRKWQPPKPKKPEVWPSVAVQIPVYNERDVVTRVISAAGKMSYPGQLTIQVLDDSTDDTSVLAAAALSALEKRGVQVQHIRRVDRVGFKAGALAHGIAQTDADLFLILDADFVPREDFLERAVPLLHEDDVACVQTRWGHLNPDVSRLSSAQALGIDVHFAVEQRARSAADWPVAFNGTGGLWRRSAMEDAGGWSADTLTEDLDLSYRAWLRGWRIVYSDELVCPGEIPERMNAFKAQQRRWASGSTTTTRKLLGRIWRSEKRFWAKVQATLHLTHYWVHPFMLLSAIMAIPLGLWTPAGSAWWHALPPLAMATGGPVTMSLIVSGENRNRENRNQLWLQLRDVGHIMLLGTGLALSNTIAVLRGLKVGGHVFERTAKGGQHSSYMTSSDRLALGELVCSLGCALIGFWLLNRGIYTIVPFLFLYAAGLARVGVATLRDTRRAGSHPVVVGSQA